MLEKIDSFEIENLMLSADENGIVQVVLQERKNVTHLMLKRLKN